MCCKLINMKNKWYLIQWNRKPHIRERHVLYCSRLCFSVYLCTLQYKLFPLGRFLILKTFLKWRGDSVGSLKHSVTHRALVNVRSGCGALALIVGPRRRLTDCGVPRRLRWTAWVKVWFGVSEHTIVATGGAAGCGVLNIWIYYLSICFHN